MTKLTIAVLSDLHVPSALGLFPAALLTDDGQTVLPAKSQEFLQKSFADFVKNVLDTAAGKRVWAQKAGKLYTVVVGDAVESDLKNRSWQHVTINPATVVDAADQVLRPLTSRSDRTWIIRGTEAHVGLSGNLEELLGERIGAERDPGGNYSWWHLLADMGGTLFEFAHHVSRDGREWTAGGAMNRLSKETVIQYAERGEPVPRFTVRGHTHQYRDSFGTSAICRAMNLPGWTLLSAYAYRLGARGLMPDIGGFIFTVDGADVDVKVKLYHAPRRLPWTETK